MLSRLSAAYAGRTGQCGYQVSLRSFTELHPIMHVYAQEAPLQSISAFLVYIKAFKFFNKVRRPTRARPPELVCQRSAVASASAPQ